MFGRVRSFRLSQSASILLDYTAGDNISIEAMEPCHTVDSAHSVTFTSRVGDLLRKLCTRSTNCFPSGGNMTMRAVTHQWKPENSFNDWAYQTAVI